MVGPSAVTTWGVEMDFFEQPRRPDPEPEPPHPAPAPWMGPPEAEVGCTIALDPTLVSTPTVAVAVTSVTAWSSGFGVCWTVWARRSMRHLFDIGDGGRRHGDDPLPVDGFRYGIDLGAQGRVTSLDRPPWVDSDESPTGPLLWPGGGGGSDRMVSHDTFVWPLPSDDVSFVVEWRAQGLSLTRMPLDGDAIRAAASRAVRLWPDVDGHVHPSTG